MDGQQLHDRSRNQNFAFLFSDHTFGACRTNRHQEHHQELEQNPCLLNTAAERRYPGQASLA